MKSFRNYLSEEVRPTAALKDGSIDIENPSVRGQINATLANVTAQPAVTPYIVLHRISKALAYFHIILPKRAYLEGDRGVEAIEMKQFGHRMGMTDQGEFVHDVPCKYYLFLSWHLAPSMGADYAAVGGALSSVGGMFKVSARLVDEVELQRLLAMAELSLAEECDAEHRQKMAKAAAPKDPMKDVDDSTEGTESAADSTQRKKDKKLSASKLDEVSLGKLIRYKSEREKDVRANKISSSHSQDMADAHKGHDDKKHKEWSDEAKWLRGHGERMKKGIALADKKMKGKARVNASMPKHPYMEETLDEGRMPPSVIRHKQKLANMTPEEKAKKFAGKSEEQLKSMARRHGYGKDSTEYSKHVKEEQIDELYGKGRLPEIAAHHEKKRTEMDMATLSHQNAAARANSLKTHQMRKDKWKSVRKKEKVGRTGLGTYTAYWRKSEGGPGISTDKGKPNKPAKPKSKMTSVLPEENLDEKLTKGMSAADVIHDFVHSDDPKFKGKSKKERQKMALGAYYGMHPEKSKVNEEQIDEMASRIKKSSIYRKFATGVNTQVKQVMGRDKGETKTILVTRKGDPRAAAGGGVIRIPRSKYDPAKYNLASE